uniref:Interleukin 18 receptor 1 n=2 Tax=Nothobranchius rachovii TaxID=451742 RepID=A0A1A8NYF3_9TELE
MACAALVLALLFIVSVSGLPPLPPLPMKDGCYQVSPEVDVFRVEGEAVILYFPMFMRVLNVRKIIPPMAKYDISRLTVLINKQPYKVSRAFTLHVQGSNPAITTTVPKVSTSAPDTHSTPNVGPPVIVSPVNGTIFESPHGSGLELHCQVVIGCEEADSTVVSWLINGQSVESSYLDKRALQGGRRVTRLTTACQVEMRLIISLVTEEDEKTEMKCIAQNTGGRHEIVTMLQLEDSSSTWLIVAMVTTSCFLTVVSIFLYALFKPKRKNKMDYFLARQNSTFSV